MKSVNTKIRHNNANVNTRQKVIQFRTPSYVVNREREEDMYYKCRNIDNKIRELNAKIYRKTNHINSMDTYEYEEIEEYIKKVKTLEIRKNKIKKYMEDIYTFDDLNYDENYDYNYDF